MKQKINILANIFAIILLASCNGGYAVKKEKTNDWTVMGLKGQVSKLVEETEHNSNKHYYTFNEKGYLNEEGYISTGLINKTTAAKKYEYAADGNISCVNLFDNISGNLEKKLIYNGDMLVEENKYSNNKVSFQTFYTYDTEGLLIKSMMNKEEQSRSEYECDAAGNILTKTSYYNGKPSTVLKYSYKYDKHGNITKYERYYAQNLESPKPTDGEVEWVEEKKYDDNGRLLEQRQETYNMGGKENQIVQKNTFTYQYDDNDNVIEMDHAVCNYVPNSKKKTIEEHCGDPIPTIYIYTYDKHGNWTSREKQYKGKSQETVIRNYIYYGEEPPKFSASEMVGPWDYYSDPNEKFEMVFMKNGTFIDYIDFHSTGTYKVNPVGTVITMVFCYNDGETSQNSKPMDFNIVEYTGDRLVLEHEKATLYYDRKAKSENYTGTDYSGEE